MNEAIPIAEQPLSAGPKQRRGYRFALIGLLFGFTGLGTAAYRVWGRAEAPPPAKTSPTTDKLFDAMKKTVELFRHKQPAPTKAEPPAPVAAAWPTLNQLGMAASICGFVAVVFACISWLVGEQPRWTVEALIVGIAALAWPHVVVTVSIAVGIVVFIGLIIALIMP